VFGSLGGTLEQQCEAQAGIGVRPVAQVSLAIVEAAEPASRSSNCRES
jgi:hypothetical protein